MSVPTFKECKKILEDFYKERIKYNIDEMDIIQSNPEINIYENRTYLYFKTFITFTEERILICDFLKHTKPIIYYAYSYTKHRKHVKDDFILNESCSLFYFLYESINNEHYISNLKIILPTYYDFSDMDYDFYFYAISNLEENGELIISPIESTHEDTDTEDDETTPEKPKVINLFKIFKSDECIVCMNDKPNILFCNCGHLCECDKCYKIKTPSICPICKMDNEIIRMLE